MGTLAQIREQRRRAVAEVLLGLPAEERVALEDMAALLDLDAATWLAQGARRYQIEEGHIVFLGADPGYLEFDPEAPIGIKDNGEPDYADQYIARDNAPFATLPPSIGALRSLVTLNLRWNQLRALPPEILSLEHLVDLDLHHNSFDTLTAPLTSMRLLERLVLDYTPVETIDPSIEDLESIEELWLGFWPTYRGPCWNRPLPVPNTIGKLRNLRKLVLTFIPRIALPPEIAGLEALECLVLEGTQVVEGAEHLKRLPPTCVVKYRTY